MGKTKQWTAICIVVPVCLCLMFLAGIRYTVRIDVVSRPVRDVQVIYTAMGLYKDECGEYPTGNSHAVFQALTGKNPKHAVFVMFRFVNAEGDPIDPWGTPYKIYVDGNDYLVRSAGPNKKFDQGNCKESDDYIY